MNKEFISHIGFEDITDYISNTKDILIISLPNIYEELCESIISFKKKNNIKNTKIIIDNSEGNYRNGFGEIKAIEKLKKEGIEIYELKGNLVSFIIFDDLGYYLFPQSRIFSGEEDLTSNAVLIDPISILRLKSYFFPQKNIIEKEEIKNQVIEGFEKAKDFMKNTIDELDKEKQYAVKTLKESEISKVKNLLDKNPPLHPDLERQIETYKTKVQFVELSFQGSNLNSKDITLPSKALPFKDAEIRDKLKTKMKLFDEIEKRDEFKPFQELKQKIDNIRKRYLIPLTSRNEKNIIKVEEKMDFENSINAVIECIPQAKQEVIEFLDTEILNSEDRIRKELQLFLEENPPDDVKNYKPDIRKRKIEHFINELFGKVNFPKAMDLLDNISIKYHYYDLTFEDLKAQELLDEFEEKGIMNKNDIESIVKIKKAFEAKK
jgi:hypothetical protein